MPEFIDDEYGNIWTRSGINRPAVVGTTVYPGNTGTIYGPTGPISGGLANSTGTMPTPPGGYPTMDEPTNPNLTGSTGGYGYGGPATPNPVSQPGSVQGLYNLGMHPLVKQAQLANVWGAEDDARWAAYKRQFDAPSRPRTGGPPADMTTEVGVRHAQEDAADALKVLQHGSERQRRAIIDQLTARGLGRSGELGFQEGELTFETDAQTRDITRERDQTIEMLRAQRAEQLANYARSVANANAGYSEDVRRFEGYISYTLETNKIERDRAMTKAYFEAYAAVLRDPSITAQYGGIDPASIPSMLAGALPTAPAGTPTSTPTSAITPSPGLTGITGGL
jgi:hypothetical protein